MLELNKQQRNDIFDLVRQSGMDPAKFKWGLRHSFWIKRLEPVDSFRSVEGEVADSAQALTIQLDGKVGFFTFEQEGTFYHSSNPQLPDGPNLTNETWDELIQSFEHWLRIVKYEIEEPDLWKNPLPDSAFPVPNDYGQEKFSETERLQLASVLREMQEQIRSTANLTAPQSIKIERVFIYLEQKLETSSKIDWRNIFIGTFTSLLAEPWFAPASQAIRDFMVEKIPPFFQHLIG